MPHEVADAPGAARFATESPYADAAFYDNMCGAGCMAKIREHWTPHLDGTRSIPESLPNLVAAFK